MDRRDQCCLDSTTSDKLFPWYDYKTADLDRIWLLTATPLLFSTVLTLTGVFYYVYLGTLSEKVDDTVLYTNYAYNISNLTYLMCFIITILVGKWQFLLIATIAQLFAIYSQLLLAYLLYLSMLPLKREFNIVRLLFTCWLVFTTLASIKVLTILIAYIGAMCEGGSEWDLREPKSERLLRHERLALEAKKRKGINFENYKKDEFNNGERGSIGNNDFFNCTRCASDSSGSEITNFSELV